MNKSYKTVWNETTGTYVAASEEAKSKGKASRNRKVLAAALLAAGVGFGTAVKAEVADNLQLSNASSSTCAVLPDGMPDPSNAADCTQASQATTTNGSQSTRPALLGATLLGATAPVTDPTIYIAMSPLPGATNSATGATDTDLPKVVTSNSGSIAIGGGSQSMAINSIAVGVLSAANGSASTALGYHADALGTASVAVGEGATAVGNNSVSVGFLAGYSATSDFSVSLGARSVGLGTGASALGDGATASGISSVALGYNSIATRDNTVSVGAVGSERQIVNVAAGTQATDAVNYAQLQAAGLKTDTSGNATNSFVAYDDTTSGTVTLGGASGTTLTNVKAGAVSASSTDAVNGSQLFATNTNVTSLQNMMSNITGGSGAGIKYFHTNSSSTDSIASGFGSVAIGGGSTASATNAIVMGALSKATAQNSLRIGSTTDGSAGAVAADAIALGTNAAVDANSAQAIAIGRAAQATNAVNGVALGNLANVTAANAVALGASSTADRANTVSVGSSGAQRQIVNVAAGTQTTDAVNVGQLQAAGLKTDSSGNATNSFVAYNDTTLDQVTLGGASGTTLTNVAAGAVSASSTDAVNGSQLYATNQNVTANTSAIAQNTADISTNAGNIAQNSSNITNIDSRVTTVEGSVTSLTDQLNSGEVGLVQQDATSGDLTVGASTDGVRINMAGTAGNRVVTGVAAGAVNGSSSDAVNGSQLYATNQNVTANTSAITQNTADISTNAGNIAQNTSDIAQNTSNITNIDARVTTVEGSVTNLTDQLNSGEVGLVQQDATSGDLTVGASTDGVRINMAGTAGNRVVTGVAAGAVNGSSSDAVNGSQLYATNQNVAQNTTDISTINSQIAGLGGGVASALSYDTPAHDIVTLAGASGTTLTNVKAGAVTVSSTDAVNGSQLYATNQNVTANTSAIAQNTADISTNTGNIAQNTSDIAQNTSNITNIDSRVTTVEGSVTNLTDQLNSGEVGLVQQDATSRDLTVASATDGTRVNFTGTAGARELIGVAAGTTSNSAVNLGQLSPFVASLGGGAQVNADGSIVSPTYHMQGGTQTTVGGALDTLDTNLSSLETQINNGSIGMVTQDATSRDLNIGATTDGLRVNLAGTAGNRVVTGVAAGAVNAASSDAVNGSQLYSNAASTAAALGGGSTVNADGTVSAPSYSVGGTTVNNVGAAIGNLDGRVSQNTSDIASLQTTVGSISGSVANAVQYDSAAHDKVTMGGSADAPKVKLTNLQDGDLSATSTDAVTGAQLWNTNQQLSDLSQSVQNQQQTGSNAMSIDTTGAPAAAATGNGAVAIGGGAQASGDNSVAIGSGSVADQANTVSVGSQGNERRITNVADGQAPTDAVNMRQFQSGVNNVARNAYSGVAAATALTMIPEVDAGKTLAVGVAGATYKGYQAAAVGASARITANLKVKVGAGISGSETTVGAGASYQW